MLTAPDGAKALQVAAHDHPDVIVLDLGLPDRNGTDVIIGLRGWCTTPIIVLSARTDSSDKVEALDAGADDYVTKPFGMAELRAAVRPCRHTPHRQRSGPARRIAVHRSRRQARHPRRRHRPPHPHRVGHPRLPGRHSGKLVSQRQLLTEG